LLNKIDKDKKIPNNTYKNYNWVMVQLLIFLSAAVQYEQ